MHYMNTSVNHHLLSIPWSQRPGVVHAGLARPGERTVLVAGRIL